MQTEKVYLRREPIILPYPIFVTIERADNLHCALMDGINRTMRILPDIVQDRTVKRDAVEAYHWRVGQSPVFKPGKQRDPIVASLVRYFKDHLCIVEKSDTR